MCRDMVVESISKPIMTSRKGFVIARRSELQKTRVNLVDKLEQLINETGLQYS